MMRSWSLGVPSGVLASALWPSAQAASKTERALRGALLAIAGSLVLVASAKAQVPFWPVPMTLQTLALQLLVMGLGARYGAAAVALYLLEGAVGLPVFAGSPERGVGLAYMVGPTGGYLVGFVAAALAMGALAERGWSRRWTLAFAAGLIGTVIILSCGVAWLTTQIGFDKAIDVGLTPFLWPSLVKVAFAAALLPLCWRLARR
jgi:biotin transport system substrate-specific component